MNVNVFNDCENEYLLLDAQYLFKITFVQQSSNLLNNILTKYPTNISRLENTWNNVLKGQSIVDHVSFAYLFVLNTMVLEAENAVKIQSQQIKDADPNATSEDITSQTAPQFIRFLEGKLNSKLVGKQAQIFLKVLKLYSDSILTQGQNAKTVSEIYNTVIVPSATRLSVQKPLVYNDLMGCDANEFMVSRFFDGRGDYGLNVFRDANSNILLAAIDLLQGETPPAVMSVNTLAFPTTVAPIIAFNSPSSEPKVMVGLAKNLKNTEQLAEFLEQRHRISNTGEVTEPARQEIFSAIESVARSALSNGELQAFASTISARLNADVDALSKDRSSPYFGMSPTSIKAGFLSKLLGGSKGYNELAFKVDQAITRGIRTIKRETNNANFANSMCLIPTPQYSDAQRDAHLAQSNAVIKNTTESINSLITYGSPMFEIDQAILQRRGFKAEFQPIQPPPRENGLPLAVVAAKVGKVALVAVGVAAVAVVISMFINKLNADTEVSRKNTLDQVKGLTAQLLSVLTTAKQLATDTDLSVAQSYLRTQSQGFTDTVIPLLTVLLNENEDSALVSSHVASLKQLYAQTIDIANDTSISITAFQTRIDNLKIGVDASIQSVNKSITIQEKIVKEAEDKDTIGEILNALKGAANTTGKVLNYAMYITLGLFSIWGGVKLYRSLNSEED